MISHWNFSLFLACRSLSVRGHWVSRLSGLHLCKFFRGWHEVARTAREWNKKLWLAFNWANICISFRHITLFNPQKGVSVLFLSSAWLGCREIVPNALADSTSSLLLGYLEADLLLRWKSFVAHEDARVGILLLLAAFAHVNYSSARLFVQFLDCL